MPKNILLYLFTLLMVQTVPAMLAVQDTGAVFLEIEADQGSQQPATTHDTASNHGGLSVDSLPALEKEPVLRQFVPIIYPAELAKRGIAGSIMLDLLVDEQGKVDSIGVVRGLHPLIDSAVVKAAASFSFDPAIAAGTPVPVIITYEYRVTFDAVIDSIQEYINFTGMVLERGTRDPVAGADVIATFSDTTSDTSLSVPLSRYLDKIGSFSGQSNEGNAVMTVTDSIGRFQFKSLPNGPCRVGVPMIGYEAFTADEELCRGEVLDVLYRLQRVNYSEYEIVVYGKEETREVGRRTLSVSEVRKIPGFSGDAVKVVQALPGVARSFFGGGAVIVRGAPTWDSKFYLDGIAMPQLYHFGGIKSTYNSDALQSIDFYPGGFSTRFGGAIAGVIDLEGRSAKSERPHGFGDVSLLDATAFLEAPVGKKVSVLAGARRSYIGDLLGFAVDKLSIIKLPITVAPYYYDYLVRSDVAINKNQKAFLTFFGSKDALELIVPFMRSRGTKEVSELADRVRQMQLFSMGIAGWDIVTQTGWENRMRAGVTYSKGYGSVFDFATFNAASWEYTLRDEVSYAFSTTLKLNVGIDLWWQQFTFQADFPNVDNTIFKLPEATTPFGLTGAWLDAEYRPLPRLLVIPGIRFDYYHELKYDGSVVPEFWDYRGDRYRRGISGEPSLRLSSRYELTDKQTVKFALGTYNQTPQPKGFSTSEALGNPHLPATRARHIVAGYEHRFTDLIFADLQVYHNQQWGIPDFASAADIYANDGAPSILPNGKGRMYGLEILLRHDNSERFFGWIAYTLARTERYNRAEDRYALYNRDQTHNLQLVASYRFPRQWEAGTRIRYVSGNPYTPIVGSVNDATNRYYRPLPGKENALRNDPFFQMDLRIDKKFIFDRWMFSAYLDMQNVLVFLYQSPEFTTYNYDYTEKSTISMPFIPSLGIRAEF